MRCHRFLNRSEKPLSFPLIAAWYLRHASRHASTATGAEDLFTDGKQGFIVPDRDVDALTKRMQQIADDPALQRKLSEAAMLRVKTLGGWDQYGETWDRLLHQLTGKPCDPH